MILKYMLKNIQKIQNGFFYFLFYFVLSMKSDNNAF